MKLKNVLIVVNDIERSQRFYRQLFGLQVVTDLGGNVIMSEGLVLQERRLWEDGMREHVSYGGMDMELYFEEQNMDAFLKKLCESEFQIDYVNSISEYGQGRRMLRIADPDGHIIEVRETAKYAAGQSLQNEEAAVGIKQPLQNEEAAVDTKQPLQNEETAVGTKQPLQNEETAVGIKQPPQYRECSSRNTGEAPNRMNSFCMRCIMDKQMKRVEGKLNEEERTAFLLGIMRLFTEAETGASAPVLVGRINRLYTEYVKECSDYSAIKRYYNQLMLSKERTFEIRIADAEDPLRTALELARIANYIDFAALDSVDEQELDRLFDKVEDNRMDERTYRHFCEDLEKGKCMVYITDNCGEIVLDKLAVQQIKKTFPHLELYVLVRGGEVLNDASMEDAEMVHMEEAACVVSNGTAIAGTYLAELADEARNLLLEADVILAKGQGNFESLNGCGLNIYYSFLCKCAWFVKRFGLEQFKGVFVNDRELLS